MRRAILLPLVLLVVLHVAVLFAGFLAPYSPERQHRTLAFAAPTHFHFSDIRPRVSVLQFDPEGGYLEDRNRSLPVRFLVDGDPYRIAGIWRSRKHLFGVEEPGAVFLMGSDEYGRDQFSRFLHGAQVSLLAGPLAACLALSLGALIGAIAGFYGRFADDILMAAAELFLSLPWFYLLLGVRASLPLDLRPEQAFFAIITVLGIVGWARPARLVRGIILTAKEREFVRAARAFGGSNLYLLRRHMLPQAKGVLLTQAALLFPQYILAEIVMTFLGLGVNEPAASWGLLLANLQNYQTVVSRWWMWIPAVLVIPVFLLYYLLAAALGGFDGTAAAFKTPVPPGSCKP